jgi:mono/diheme cytochrome c family protein
MGAPAPLEDAPPAQYSDLLGGSHMQMPNLTHSTGFVLLSLLAACGGSEPDGPCGEEPVAKAETAPTATTKAAPAGNLKPWTELDDAALVQYGEKVFLAKGSNTCNDCHGKDGKKGRLEQAADLTQPTGWRINKVYGVGTDKAGAALAYLISSGGKKFNGNFETDNPDSGWDWAKAEASGFDIQMFGVTQSSTQAAIKKIRKELKADGYQLDKSDMTAFGTRSVVTYLASIEAK